LALLGAACAGRAPAPPPAPPPTAPRPTLSLIGHAIQVGAFARIENAVRLTASLQGQGLEATYFRDSDHLYKVRFGDFPTEEAARQRAEELRGKGIIEVFHIVAPDPYAAAHHRGDLYVRERIVESAGTFVGVPYLWGGTVPETGFDCSGLTMAAYRLNGLDLPRTTREQFMAGDPVQKGRMAKADLVFFGIHKKGTASHVGIYIGDGKFIHAPGRGKIIRIDSLSNAYFRQHFLGARSYL